MSETGSGQSGSKSCLCTKEPSSSESTLSAECHCPRDEHGIVVHQQNCLFFKHEVFVHPDDVCECEPLGEFRVCVCGQEVCECDSLDIKDGLPQVCVCGRVKEKREEGQSESDICVCGRSLKNVCVCDLPEDIQKARLHVCVCESPDTIKKALEEWRSKRDEGPMPAVLESTHPLMQRFQLTLREFLLKENALAEDELNKMRDELQESKKAYDRDLETMYKVDHDTNAQRKLIEEYEASLAQRSAEREEADNRAKNSMEKHKQATENLDQMMTAEREAMDEMEALSALCRQLEKWREETESNLTVSRHMSVKMKNEKRALADDKRHLDMMIYGLTNEVWKLESKLEMFRKQMEIKSVEMDKINDKVTVYATELEDLDLDKRRLLSLWNSVLINISQRDKVFDSVREDYRELKENFSTLVINLEVTANLTEEEMQKSRELAMTKDKIMYDADKANVIFEKEDHRRIALETQLEELTESIEMTDRDTELIKMENQNLRDILKTTENDLDRKIYKKLTVENEILANLEECLLNDKAVEAMVKGIKDMREMSRKQELSLTKMENQHDKLMLDLELLRSRQVKNDKILARSLAKVRAKEQEVEEVQSKYTQKEYMIMRKKRELASIMDKHVALKEMFDLKSPQERRIDDIEKQIKEIRHRTTQMQYEWLRQQGHVVRLAEQYQKTTKEVNLIYKQVQVCEQKIILVQRDSNNVVQEKARVDRVMRELRGQLEVLERTRKEALERNVTAQKGNVAVTQEYAVNLKNAEMGIIELEEEINAMDKEKVNLTQELDRVQREGLIWQRKGILAVELKKSMKEAKSSAGEIGQMRIEIHRMEAHREQLRRTGEKLSEDLAHYVLRRESALEKTRASAAVQKACGPSKVSQSAYYHKLRTARADLASVMKECADAEARLKQLLGDQERLSRELVETKSQHHQLEERIAELIQEYLETKRQKRWLLERVVRSQRLGSELATVVKRQSLRIRKPSSVLRSQYASARALNTQIEYVRDRLHKEYSQFGDKLSIIKNTLDIHSPSGSPRLIEMSSTCDIQALKENIDGNVAEKPLCP